MTIDGVRRPDNPQMRAGLRIVDIQTGETLSQVPPITKIDDGTVMIVGGGAKGAGLRRLKAAEQARLRIFKGGRLSTHRRHLPWPRSQPDTRAVLGLPAAGPNSRVLWSSQTVE